MRYLVWLFCLLSLTASAQMSHEETVVRTAYAKFAYAVEQGAISHLALESTGHVPKQYQGLSNEQRLRDAQVVIALKDFTVGNTADIFNRKIADFVTAPQQRLDTSGQSFNYSDADGAIAHWFWLEGQWHPAAEKPLPPQALDLTVADAYRMQWQEDRPTTLWQRYAAYTVTLSFLGKTRTYKAMFIFGHDPQGNEVVEPEDPTAGNTALASALHEALFPAGFLSTKLRNYQVVSDWISSVQMSDDACTQHNDLCCDLAQLKCGPGRTDVAKSLQQALPEGGSHAQ
jgi:hypothetical protein